MKPPGKLGTDTQFMTGIARYALDLNAAELAPFCRTSTFADIYSEDFLEVLQASSGGLSG
jgi:hypothetical protein